MAEKQGFKLHSKPRGSPENVGEKLKAVHPVIRTNPVSGWKSIFPVGAHVSHINNVTAEESKNLLKWFYDLVQDHSVQVRLRWQNANDIGKKGPSAVVERSNMDLADIHSLVVKPSGTTVALFTLPRMTTTPSVTGMASAWWVSARGLSSTRRASLVRRTSTSRNPSEADNTVQCPRERSSENDKPNEANAKVQYTILMQCSCVMKKLKKVGGVMLSDTRRSPVITARGRSKRRAAPSLCGTIERSGNLKL